MEDAAGVEVVVAHEMFGGQLEPAVLTEPVGGPDPVPGVAVAAFPGGPSRRLLPADGAVAVPQGPGDRGLVLEIEDVVLAPHREVQLVADPPQVVPPRGQGLDILGVEEARPHLGEIRSAARLQGPLEQVDLAQAAGALLDVRLRAPAPGRSSPCGSAAAPRAGSPSSSAGPRTAAYETFRTARGPRRGSARPAWRCRTRCRRGSCAPTR